MFIAGLFIVTKTWKQPKCPSTDEWIKKMSHTHTHTHTHTLEYCSAIKKNELMPYAATWMDLEMIILSEVGQIDKNKYIDKYHNMSLICGVLKIIQMNLFSKQKQTHRHRKQTYSYQRGKGQRRGKLVSWD